MIPLILSLPKSRYSNFKGTISKAVIDEYIISSLLPNLKKDYDFIEYTKGGEFKFIRNDSYKNWVEKVFLLRGYCISQKYHDVLLRTRGFTGVN